MASIMILGEVLVDVFPEQTIIGGAPYNVACHCHAMGLDVKLISAVGKDALGERILSEMEARGLSRQGVQIVPHLPTGQVMVRFVSGGHYFEILDAQAYDGISWQAMQPIVASACPDLVYIGSLALRHPPMRQLLATWLKQVNCPVFCDINLRAPWYDRDSLLLALQSADILKINHEELPIVCQQLGLAAGNDMETAVHQLIKAFQLKEIFVTCGAGGSFWMSPAGETLYAPVVELVRPLVDSVGAGDAFSAIAMRGILAADSRAQLLAQAAKFAAEICCERGALPADKSFYRDFCTTE